MVRITLADSEDMPDGKADYIKTLSPKDGLPSEYHHLIDDPDRNIYRALGVNFPILQRFRGFGKTVWEECGLTARERELVILAVSRHLDAEYEWHQHVRVALKEGLSPDEIQRVSDGRLDEFDDREAVLMQYVGSYLDDVITDEDHERLGAHFDEPTIVGIASLIGTYLFISKIIEAFDVDVEEPFVGWDLDQL